MNKTILLLARFCKEIGLFDFVASPGSRSAPILLALSRIGGIEIEMVMDERSAGYVALGKSLALKKPVGLFCTSGTAALNLGPAIAEAFYQNVPLFVLTADRPAELIDQHEGQAIRQNGLFELHTVFSATLPSTESSEQSEAHCIRILQQAWQFSTALRPGPVHLNVPLREPLYPNHPLDFESVPFRVLEVKEEKSKPLLDRYVLSPLLEKWTQSPSRLVICGQMPPDWDLRNALKALSEYGDVPIVGDLAHNQFAFPGLIHHADLFPDTAWEAPELVPDILLTIGNGLVSKQIKRFIQRAKFREHWHIQAEGQVANPFGTISHIIRADPEWMLTKLGEGVFFQNQKEKNKCYLKWMEWEEKTKLASQEFHFHSAWGDGKAVFTLFQNLPEKAILFPGNSMPIRYCNWNSSNLKSENQVFANRGTSGIDGCLSTALGIAEVKIDRLVLAILGDMGFFYDRNALWRNSIPPNLKICILNNGGGNIFRILPASSQLPELEGFFEMEQPFKAELASRESGLPYFKAKNEAELLEAIPLWLASPQAAVLECLTDKIENALWVKNLKKWIAS